MNINELYKQLQDVAEKAVANVAAPFAEQAKQDALGFVRHAADNLVRYAKMRLAGQITDDELMSLVKGQGALATMTALTVAGMAQIEIEKLKDQVLDAVGGALGSLSKGLVA